MRVVAGELRGRRIESPPEAPSRGKGGRGGEHVPHPTTRPTTDKVREAVFNALGSMDVLDGARVLDLFAGTGAMGIEALSRGAAECTFVERDRVALDVLRRNIDHLGLESKSRVISGDATVGAAFGSCDLLIADPPYGFTQWGRMLNGVTASVVVLESGAPIGDVAGWATVREKRYGRTYVAFLIPADAQSDTVEDA